MKTPGILKINANGIGWKTKTGASEVIDGSSIVGAKYMQTTPTGFQVELKMKNGNLMKFDGFKAAVSCCFGTIRERNEYRRMLNF